MIVNAPTAMNITLGNTAVVAGHQNRPLDRYVRNCRAHVSPILDNGVSIEDLHKQKLLC